MRLFSPARGPLQDQPAGCNEEDRPMPMAEVDAMRTFAIAGLGLGLMTLAVPPARGDVIRVLGAVYGTPSEQRTCDATAAVAAVCDGKKSCDVLAANSLCGDPHYGTPKTLDVQYRCALAVAKSLTASEQSAAHLSCD